MKDKGFALVGIIIAFVLISLMALFFTNLLSVRSTTAVEKFKSIKALYLSEGGLEYVLKRRTFPNYAATNISIEDGSFSVYTSSTPNGKLLKVVGNYDGVKRTIGTEVIKSPPTAFNTSIPQATTAQTLIWSHTVPNSADRILLVGVSLVDDNDPIFISVSTITFAGQPLTRLGFRELVHPVHRVRVEIWYLINPPIGTGNIILTLNETGASVLANSVSFSGIDTTNPFLYPVPNAGNFISNALNANSISVNITTTAPYMILFDVLSIRNPAAGISVTPEANQNILWSARVDPVPNVYGAASIREVSSIGTYTMRWSFNAICRCVLGATALRLKDQTGGSIRIINKKEVLE